MKTLVKTETLWNKCPSCDQIIYKKELEENSKICPKCQYYLRMNAWERIALLVNKDDQQALVFNEMDAGFSSKDPLQFYDSTHLIENAVDKKISYLSKIAAEQKKTKNYEAIISGEAEIGLHKVVLAVLDFEFMAGSMGSVVGERVTRAIEYALEKKYPCIIISASGGARMQEGSLSLMQMAKTSAALARLSEAGVLAISVLCDPTTGGVTASFAMLGDILIAEPKALIAFAGPRVIEQTLRQKLPDGFQQSEFLLKHGMIDCIVSRKEMREKLISFLNFFKSNSA